MAYENVHGHPIPEKFLKALQALDDHEVVSVLNWSDGDLHNAAFTDALTANRDLSGWGWGNREEPEPEEEEGVTELVNIFVRLGDD